MSSRPFRKHGTVPLATYMRVYNKGDSVDFKGRGMSHKHYHGKTGSVSSVTQHTAGTVVSKKVKGKTRTVRADVHIERINHSKGCNCFMKCVKEND